MTLSLSLSPCFPLHFFFENLSEFFHPIISMQTSEMEESHENSSMVLSNTVSECHKNIFTFSHPSSLSFFLILFLSFESSLSLLLSLILFATETQLSVCSHPVTVSLLLEVRISKSVSSHAVKNDHREFIIIFFSPHLSFLRQIMESECHTISHLLSSSFFYPLSPALVTFAEIVFPALSFYPTI